ncbi:transketolase [Chloroflexi bacterium TSY]|nr:transketolase [Chloroflexi bacterium TSY]
MTTILSRSKFGVFGYFQSRLQGFWSHLFRFRLQKTTYFISENRPNLTQKLDIDRQICIYVNCLARILSQNLKFGSTDTAALSRQISLLIRREVLSGRANFGVYGDGKEVAQLAMERAFQPGDFRAGYYRDQTFMLATQMLSPQQLFAQLYTHMDIDAEPSTGGRSMVAHFGTRLLDANGHWYPQVNNYNSSADISPTSGQMPRLVGLGYASRLYRELDELHTFSSFSRNGSEIAFGTIGNASCAEGLFWESLNAIPVLQAPVIISIWDDGYGISVPNEVQFAKGSVGPLLEGFRRQPDHSQGFDMYQVHGWDYRGLITAYEEAARQARKNHIPAIIHVTEMTQPQGHSTSGSHERYKSNERLAWEADHDPLVKMNEWIVNEGLATKEKLKQLEAEAKEEAETARDKAWDAMLAPRLSEAGELAALLKNAAEDSFQGEQLIELSQKLQENPRPLRREIMQIAHQAALVLATEEHPVHEQLLTWCQQQLFLNRKRYSSHLHSQSEKSALTVPVVSPTYDESVSISNSVGERVRGYEILRANFDTILANDPRVFIFGEDVGKLGDVNQGVAGLQAKYGSLRVSDTGIREATIVGQAIGMALRGLRPIAEIQYIDYILYAIQTLSDDLATLHWRTKGGQKAPVIIRTRGHRLDGIWHSGSPMGALLNLLSGMHILVPRNMTQAAGFYNTLLRSDEPAIVVERLNAYRLYEPMPTNLGEFTVPLGVPELLCTGSDLTLVTYGAMCDIALNAAARLQDLNISVEVIDVQSLLPFDIHHSILESLRKTSRILFVDEDMPSGASAFMMQQVLQIQGAYRWLDSEPRTLSAPPHRPATGPDGDYFSKPNAENIVETIYNIMHESDPRRYPTIWAVAPNSTHSMPSNDTPQPNHRFRV